MFAWIPGPISTQDQRKAMLCIEVKIEKISGMVKYLEKGKKHTATQDYYHNY